MHVFLTLFNNKSKNDYLCCFTCQPQKNYWGPPTAPPPKRISTEGKIVSKYHGGGMNLRVRPRVKRNIGRLEQRIF